MKSGQQMMDALSDEEKAQITPVREAHMEQAAKAFNALDVNGDGQVPTSEILKAGLPDVDVTSDLIDKARLEIRMQSMMEMYDTDGDGKITKDEWLGKMGAIFD